MNVPDPHTIVKGSADRFDVTLDDLRSTVQSGPALSARQLAAFALWVECTDLTLADIARLIGRSDHSAARHAILAEAAHRGMSVARVSELRGQSGDGIDWTKLAYLAAGWREARALVLAKAAQKSGIGRGEWRKAELGQSVSAATLLKICHTTEIDPFTLLADQQISHETNGKHGAKHDGGNHAAS